MTDEKFTHSKKYSDRCLKEMAIMSLGQIDGGEGDGLALVMTISQRTGIHPQAVVDRIRDLANRVDVYA